MPRDTFPYPDDRVAVECFLSNEPHDADTLHSNAGVLSVQDQTCCYYDTLGNLMGTVTTETWTSLYCAHTINYILELLGSAERVTRELIGRDQVGNGAVAWFYGTQRITLGVPFVICGPLSVQAWRSAGL